jgi:diguanylate cyclase (GGDEF)-like protein
MTRKFGKLHLRAHAGLPERLQRELVSLNIADQGFASSRAAALRMEVLINRPPGAPAAPKPIDPGTNQQGAIDDELLPQCRELQASSFNACLSVPLLSADCEVLGVVAFFDADDETYDRQAMVSVSGVRDMARLAMEHQHLHAELVHQSQHDHLTGLPNRLLLEDRLERAILQAKRNGTQIAVCYLDLDHFKEINDTLGHNAGDSVLQHVTQVLKDCLRDIDTVARQGGDEFILILPGIKKEFEADEICERVLDRLRQPFEIGRQTVSVLASIGKCTYPLHGKTTTALLQNADIALYTAKRAGRARVQQYDSTQGEKVQRNIAIQRELRFALDREQFHVVYQPLFNMEAHLKGFEALLRWDHPELGVIGPDHFIPLAEESGIIGPIGEWVLNQACQQAQKWNLASVRPVKIYVNVSGVQLGQAQFTGAVAKALALSGLPPKLLDLEITETCIIADIDSACIRLKELRQLGIRISIDDFGCGHSSFSYLQQLPIDSIKIDRSFISCLDGTDKKSAIVRTIVALARELGLETVAEGVETGQQFEELQTTDCTMVQGFLLSRPLSPDDASQLLSFERGILPSKSAASLTANVSSVPLLP